MSAQPDGLNPDVSEIWVAQVGHGFRMYFSEKQARRFAYGKWLIDEETQRVKRDEDGNMLAAPALVYRVDLNWERLEDE